MHFPRCFTSLTVCNVKLSKQYLTISLKRTDNTLRLHYKDQSALLVEEVIAVYYNNHTKQVNTL